MKKTNFRRLLCMDLDGTVRENKNGKTFINKASEIKLIDGVKEKILEYKEKGWLVYGITNQGGVAFGYKSEKNVDSEIEKTQELLGEAKMEKIVYCPAHEDSDHLFFGFESLLRKPNYGMLALIEVFVVGQGLYKPDWRNSLIVGDRYEDEACASNAGVPFMHASAFLKNEVPS